MCVSVKGVLWPSLALIGPCDAALKDPPLQSSDFFHSMRRGNGVEWRSANKHQQTGQGEAMAEFSLHMLDVCVGRWGGGGLYVCVMWQGSVCLCG